MVELNTAHSDLAPSDPITSVAHATASRRPTVASLAVQLSALAAENEHLRRAVADTRAEVAAARRDIAELRALLLHLAGVESVNAQEPAVEEVAAVHSHVTPPPVATTAGPGARSTSQVEPRSSAPAARNPRNWRGQWDALRQQLAREAAQAGSAELQRVQETVESYYQELVVDWELCRGAEQDSPPWNEWQLSRLDFHLHQLPSLVDSDAANRNQQPLLRNLEAVIEDAQAARRRELRDELGLERIEGEVGADCWRAYVLERDPNCLPEATPNGAWEGTFCRITPGRGGYRWQGQVLRPSYAIYYRYDG